MNAKLSNRMLLQVASCVAVLAAVAFVAPVRAERIGVRAPGDTITRKPAKPRSFTAQQQENQRVLEARVEKKLALKQIFRDRGLSYPAAETFMRIFKRERVLEVWVRGTTDGKFSLLKSYSICALAGQLGPKRAQGDNQTPEGFYYIDGFNPSSEFHLSLHIDYPNKVDQLLGRNGNPGGNIFIHGGCKTEGCLAVTDDAIKELYWLAVEARNVGQQKIPVHIFPTRLTDDALAKLMVTFDKEPELKRFWANLKPTYDFFEASRTLPLISMTERGRYQMTAPIVVAPVAEAVAAPPKTAGN